MLTRRRLLALLPLVFCNVAAWRITVHPTPRKGITSARVLKADQLKDVAEDVVRIFDMVREIPQVVDGIYCHCGCAELDGSYSLLSCYEGGGMAQACQVCQGEGRMVYELHKKGKKLDDIRAAIDRNFG
ncbi:MAG TPA: PCYCGC motif-containing (lipo)protein [Longimicrobiales bacterium]